MQIYAKSIPWIASSFLFASSLFSQSEVAEYFPGEVSEEICKAGDGQCKGDGSPLCPPLQPTCQPFVCKPQKCGNVQEPQTPSVAAYNAPAEINTGIMDDWNFFSTISFLYWQPSQDNLHIASQGSQSVSSLNTPRTTDTRKMLDMDFDFKAAFKISTGMNFRNDDWVGYVEYTRLRANDSVSASTPSNNPTIYNLWGETAIQDSFIGTSVFNSMSSKYQCKFDFIDGMMERVYFVGQRLVFHSAMGLRNALINQSLTANYAYNGAFINNLNAHVFALPSAFDAIYRTSSWGIGPRFGLEMDWMVRHGIRIFGSGYADVLYTSYEVQTKNVTTAFTNDMAPTLLVGNPISIAQKDDDFGLLRAHVDLQLGLGWGKYLDYNNVHVDFAASYGFQVFFNQNVMVLPDYSPGNLYVQGLTFTARLDY